WDLRINSPSLYRLSYRGIGEVHILMAWAKLVNAGGQVIPVSVILGTCLTRNWTRARSLSPAANKQIWMRVYE
ncbi:MAG TPA: hypothetical protein VFS89_01385, partial [Nitrosospira sp.]|nr:hypothetical protein [Nitrosospira sp.]